MMNANVFLLFLFFASYALCSEVNIEVGARFEPTKVIHDPDIFFIIDIVNESQKDIMIKKLNGEIMDCGIELWIFEKAVKLWPRADAEGKREDAFILWDKETIKAGEKKRVVLKLRDLMSGYSENDDLARTIKEEVSFLRSGTGRVVLKYYDADEEEKIAEGKFDLEKLNEEQKRKALPPAKKT